jgi:uncharacterized damage-inducible protein DinB
MNACLLTLALLVTAPAPAPAADSDKPPAPAPTLKSVLLAQLKSTHDEQDWFVPASKAVVGLTAEQAAWKEGTNTNHSISQLVQHLVFWNTQQLASWKGEKKPAFSGKNDETFGNNLDKAAWENAVRRLDEVLTGMERWIESADDASLKKQADNIAHVSAHNAYHTGQILYIRKQQGSWDPEKGVK